MILLAEFFNSPGFCDEYAYIYAALDLDAARDGHALPPPRRRR